MKTGILGRSLFPLTLMLHCTTDPHLGHPVKSGRSLEDLIEDVGWEEPALAADNKFHGDHPNDQGERTNKKLRVQPFYHRGRNGKMRNY